MVLVAMHSGTSIPLHRADGPITVHAIEGAPTINTETQKVALRPGQLLMLHAGVYHAVEALRECALPLTLSADVSHPVESDEVARDGRIQDGTETMTILELLDREDKRALLLIGRLRRRLVATGATPEPLTRLTSLLKAHARISGALLCDALDAFTETRAVVARLRSDHERLLEQLAMLRRRARSSRGVTGTAVLSRLERTLVSHADAERRIFPEARQRIGEARLEEMYYEAQRKKNHQSRLDSLIYPADRFGVW